MALSITVGVQDREVRELFDKALRATGDLRQPLSELGLFIVRAAGRRLRQRTANSETSTGQLRASLTFHAGKDYVEIGSNKVYAAVQQLGIEDMKAKPPLKRVAIPLLPKLRRMGIWPRDVPKGLLRLVKSRRGNVVLLGPDPMETKDGKLRTRDASRHAKQVPWYVLKERVSIPARPYLAFDDEAIQFFVRRLIRHMGLNLDTDFSPGGD